MTTADVYSQLRPLMFSIAYRMLGSGREAEDVVQEAFLRYYRAVSAARGGERPSRETPETRSTRRRLTCPR